MRNFAKRSEQERRELFRATAQAMQAHEAIVEKDFWVCWILDYLFQLSPWKNNIVFKGGTSLSKAYHIIERFSEDIDLILDWRLLDYPGDEPWQARSANKQNEFNMKINQQCAAFLENEFVPALRNLVENVGETKVNGKILDNADYLIMGQVCIDSKYRGKGIFRGMYEFMRKNYSNKFPYLVTEISTSNFRSLKAHESVGFREVRRHKNELDDWVIVVWEWSDICIS